jgi:hypothetical protein
MGGWGIGNALLTSNGFRAGWSSKPPPSPPPPPLPGECRTQRHVSPRLPSVWCSSATTASSCMEARAARDHAPTGPAPAPACLLPRPPAAPPPPAPPVILARRRLWSSSLPSLRTLSLSLPVAVTPVTAEMECRAGAPPAPPLAGRGPPRPEVRAGGPLPPAGKTATPPQPLALREPAPPPAAPAAPSLPRRKMAARSSSSSSSPSPSSPPPSTASGSVESMPDDEAERGPVWRAR